MGFSGNRLLGLQELTRGARSLTIHSMMCSSFLLFYHTVASIMLGEYEWIRTRVCDMVHQWSKELLIERYTVLSLGQMMQLFMIYH